MADPQLLGEKFNPKFYTNLAIYDSDNFLQKTFAQALAYTKPDVICFLGDLMDEGSIATDDAYQRYLRRFHHIFKTSGSVHKMHIPGDNDIGGEKHDYVTAFKIKRFQNGFNETGSMLINNRIRLFNINVLTHTYPELNQTNATLNANKFVNIVLTHISILSYPGLTMKTVRQVTIAPFWRLYFQILMLVFFSVPFTYRLWINLNQISYFLVTRIFRGKSHTHRNKSRISLIVAYLQLI